MELVNLTVNIIIIFFSLQRLVRRKQNAHYYNGQVTLFVNHFWFCADTAETENEFNVWMVQKEIS